MGTTETVADRRRAGDDGSRDRLVVVTQAYPPEQGGNASRMGDLTQFLTETYDVTVVAPPRSYPHGSFERTWTRHERDDVGEVTVHRLWAWQPTDRDPSFLDRIAYYVTFALHALVYLLVAERDTDLVLTTSPPITTGVAALPLAAVFDVPWVVDVRDNWIEVSTSMSFVASGGPVERVSRRYQALELRVADLVLATTEGSADVLDAAYGVAGKTVVVPNGVDVERFDPDRTADGPTLVYTGNLGHCQDLENCLRAMDRLPESVTLTVVGDGDRREALETLTERLGLTERVRFTGLVPREEVPGILAGATLGLAPLVDDESLQYAVPTKLYEYMACRLPVVGVGGGELARVIRDAECGVVADNDPDSIARAIRELVDDEAGRHRLGANGRRVVEERYDRGAIARRLVERIERRVRPTVSVDV